MGDAGRACSKTMCCVESVLSGGGGNLFSRVIFIENFQLAFFC